MTAPMACPNCGRINECHEMVGGRSTPSAGDVAVCWGCREPAMYEQTPFGLAQRLLTPEETREVTSDPRVRAAFAAMAESYDPDQAVALLRGERP